MQDAPVGEEHPAPQKDMRSVPCETLKALQQRSVDAPRAELVDELIIIDSELLSIARDGSLDVPGCHYLLVRGGRICGLDCRGWGGTPGDVSLPRRIP